MAQVQAANDEVRVVDNGERVEKPSTGLKLGVILINTYLAVTFIASSLILLLTGGNDASGDSGLFFTGLALAVTNLVVAIGCLSTNVKYFKALRPYVKMQTTEGDTVWVKHPDGKSFTADQKPRIGAALLFLIPGAQFLVYGSMLLAVILNKAFGLV